MEWHVSDDKDIDDLLTATEKEGLAIAKGVAFAKAAKEKRDLDLGAAGVPPPTKSSGARS
jgi:hypothetical protein